MTRPMNALLSRGLPLAGSILLALVFASIRLQAQDACQRILDQDPTLNNLIDPPGYAPASPGTLGRVTTSGTGSQPMIIIPGLGFSGEAYADLYSAFAGTHRIYAVTLPGFGGTPAPPSPPPSVSFGEQTWTTAAIEAVEKLIADEQLERPVIVGHWLTGTQIALRLALRNPGTIRGVVLLAGTATVLPTDTARRQFVDTPAKRVASVDRYLAPRWFKTVTRETWDDNNFLPSDYALNPVRGLRLWREAARPMLHVWVRYLCEFNAQDVTYELDRLSVPVLLLRPGLEGIPHDPGNNYMQMYCHESWDRIRARHPQITERTIPGTRAFLWYDKPLEVQSEIMTFLRRLP